MSCRSLLVLSVFLNESVTCRVGVCGYCRSFSMKVLRVVSVSVALSIFLSEGATCGFRVSRYCRSFSMKVIRVV